MYNKALAPIGALNARWLVVRRRAELEDVRIHNLRHVLETPSARQPRSPDHTAVSILRPLNRTSTATHQRLLTACRAAGPPRTTSVRPRDQTHRSGPVEVLGELLVKRNHQ